MDAIPILDSRNINQTLEYYVDKLGFEIEFRYDADPNNYAGVVRDHVHLHFQWQEEKLFKNGKAGNLRVRIFTTDPDTIYNEFKAKGVFDSGCQLRNTDWRTREFGFRDIAGNGLIFYRDL